VAPQAVENLPDAQWLGCMVPKRQARRAVTRNLLKRHMRESFRRHAAALPMGLWLLRLHAGFAKAEYPSARSDALAEAVRSELDRLLAAAARRA
jgi:ribonuclease P protein component